MKVSNLGVIKLVAFHVGDPDMLMVAMYNIICDLAGTHVSFLSLVSWDLFTKTLPEIPEGGGFVLAHHVRELSPTVGETQMQNQLSLGEINGLQGTCSQNREGNECCSSATFFVFLLLELQALGQLLSTARMSLCSWTDSLPPSRLLGYFSLLQWIVNYEDWSSHPEMEAEW